MCGRRRYVGDRPGSLPPDAYWHAICIDTSERFNRQLGKSKFMWAGVGYAATEIVKSSLA